jgi:hypothetical protein
MGCILPRTQYAQKKVTRRTLYPSEGPPTLSNRRNWPISDKSDRRQDEFTRTPERPAPVLLAEHSTISVSTSPPPATLRILLIKHLLSLTPAMSPAGIRRKSSLSKPILRFASLPDFGVFCVAIPRKIQVYRRAI